MTKSKLFQKLRHQFADIEAMQGLTVKKMSEETQISQVTLKKIFSDKANPDLDIFLRLAIYLGFEVMVHDELIVTAQDFFEAWRKAARNHFEGQTENSICGRMAKTIRLTNPRFKKNHVRKYWADGLLNPYLNTALLLLEAAGTEVILKNKNAL